MGKIYIEAEARDLLDGGLKISWAGWTKWAEQRRNLEITYVPKAVNPWKCVDIGCQFDFNFEINGNRIRAIRKLLYGRNTPACRFVQTLSRHPGLFHVSYDVRSSLNTKVNKFGLRHHLPVSKFGGKRVYIHPGLGSITCQN